MKRSDLDELEGLFRALRDQQRRIDLGKRADWRTTVIHPLTDEEITFSVNLDEQKNLENERDKAMKDLKAKIDAIDWTKWEE